MASLNPFRPDGLLRLEYVFSDGKATPEAYVEYLWTIADRYTGTMAMAKVAVETYCNPLPPPLPCPSDRNALPYTRDDDLSQPDPGATDTPDHP